MSLDQLKAFLRQVRDGTALRLAIRAAASVAEVAQFAGTLGDKCSGVEPPRLSGQPAPVPSSPMAKDPIRGMVVPTAPALSAQRGSRSSSFRSQGCRQTFLAPGQDQGRMRLDGMALTGGVALAVPRAAAFIALCR